MKSILVPFKNLFKKIKKPFKRKAFLKKYPWDVLEDLEHDTAYKLTNVNCKIIELLQLKEHDLLLKLQDKRYVENFYTFLQKEIKKRDLDIDLKKYPAFKDFELKRKDKANYIKENLIN